LPDPMKCANARIENGVINFDCPYCSGGLHADESQVQQVWAAMQGQIACPVDTCQKPIVLPTIEEVALLKTGGTPEAPASASAANPQSEEPAEDKTPTEVAGASSAPKPAPAPAPAPAPQSGPTPQSESKTDSGQKPTPGAASEQEVASSEAQTAASPASAGAGTKPDIVHGFSGAVDAPMTLEQEASSGRTMAIKTIRHSDCVDGDKDTFDEEVTNFLRKQGDGNIDSVNPIQFSDDEKKPIDYGVLIIFTEDLPE